VVSSTRPLSKRPGEHGAKMSCDEAIALGLAGADEDDDAAVQLR
jgi:hypothetical protein